MSTNFDDIQQLWDAEKDAINTDDNSKEIITKITEKKNESTKFHYGNVFVLLLTLVVICAFFIFIAPVQETLSRIGAGMMISILVIRILVEIYSVKQSHKLDPTQNTVGNLSKSIEYLKLRRRIHGTFTISLIVIYTVGLTLIFPEFLYYLGWAATSVFYGMYAVSGLIIIHVIKKKIKQELIDINAIVDIKKRIIKDTLDK